MNALARNLERASSRIDRLIALRWGDRFPIYSVCEHPRSGGTWLADMLGDALQIPFPKHNLFPLGCSGVLHAHWRHSPRLRNAVYVVRDGRDVVVSLFFYCAAAVRESPERATPGYLRRRFAYLVEPGAHLDDCAGMLPRFVEDWLRKPFGCRIAWPRHVREWTGPGSKARVVRYEDLHADAAGVLARLVEDLTGAPADPERISAAVERYSFLSQTGRRPGEVRAGAAKRAGEVGGWRRHFTREAAEVFDRHCGDLLVELGYEADREWVQGMPPGPCEKASRPTA